MNPSKLHFWSYHFDFFAFPVMISATIAVIITKDVSPLYLVWFTLGLIFWSAFEYLFHRWGFHRFICARAHRLHHIDPSGYIGVSSLITSTTYVFGIFLSLFFKLPVIAILQVGLSIGYLIYITVHHQIHHGRFSGRYMNSMRRRHNRHHYCARYDFGVTMSFWDAIFGTRSTNRG
jgi:sterol desaturase/sphingolipid hydroxylase (fatty acid hydroxylase superfamily)